MISVASSIKAKFFLSWPDKRVLSFRRRGWRPQAKKRGPVVWAFIAVGDELPIGSFEVETNLGRVSARTRGRTDLCFLGIRIRRLLVEEVIHFLRETMGGISRQEPQ